MEYNSPLLTCGQCIVTSFQRVHNSHDTWRNQIIISDRWSRWAPMYVPFIFDDTDTFILVFSKTHNPSPFMRKILDKSHLRNILQNTWPVLFKTVNVVRNKERSEKLTTKRSMIAKCNVGSQNRKMGIRQKLKNLNEVWTLVSNNVSMLVDCCNK